ncbi:hypothetical protein BpHYR1_004986 [Brachionus plicatilis]|uniref:Uncharacterized protein n=1 Tax=Brachionus plicatilis TaxID=10195 RepID=A0A3M7S2N3_BRAPC|nr:hypothetical protein BpHYR1_004986 [Brachionus plicatilis]
MTKQLVTNYQYVMNNWNQNNREKPFRFNTLRIVKTFMLKLQKILIYGKSIALDNSRPDIANLKKKSGLGPFSGTLK